jgi:hypothetical protein
MPGGYGKLEERGKMKRWIRIKWSIVLGIALVSIVMGVNSGFPDDLSEIIEQAQDKFFDFCRTDIPVCQSVFVGANPCVRPKKNRHSCPPTACLPVGRKPLWAKEGLSWDFVKCVNLNPQ